MLQQLDQQVQDLVAVLHLAVEAVASPVVEAEVFAKKGGVYETLCKCDISYGIVVIGV